MRLRKTKGFWEIPEPILHLKCPYCNSYLDEDDVKDLNGKPAVFYEYNCTIDEIVICSKCNKKFNVFIES